MFSLTTTRSSSRSSMMKSWLTLSMLTMMDLMEGSHSIKTPKHMLVMGLEYREEKNRGWKYTSNGTGHDGQLAAVWLMILKVCGCELMQGCAKRDVGRLECAKALPQVRLGLQALGYRAPVRRFSVRQAGGWTLSSRSASPVSLRDAGSILTSIAVDKLRC